MGYLNGTGLAYFWQKIKDYVASHPGPKGDKGDTGDSGVYIGTSAPSDSSARVWIDTDDADAQPRIYVTSSAPTSASPDGIYLVCEETSG